MGVQYYKVCQLVKKLVLAWDPDYTKLTPSEAEAVARAEAEMDAGKRLPWVGQIMSPRAVFSKSCKNF